MFEMFEMWCQVPINKEARALRKGSGLSSHRSGYGLDEKRRDVFLIFL